MCRPGFRGFPLLSALVLLLSHVQGAPAAEVARASGQSADVSGAGSDRGWAVVVLGGDSRPGVLWAAEELAARHPGWRVETEVGEAATMRAGHGAPPAHDVSVPSETRGGAGGTIIVERASGVTADMDRCAQQAFAVQRLADGHRLRLTSPTDAGGMYALLDLQERMADGTPPATYRDRPALGLRGTAASLPLYLGTSMYNGAWEPFADYEHRTDWFWFDREHWRRAFQGYARHRMNSMVFWHPHPYVAFLDLEGYPEAAYFSAPEVQQQREMLRWIIAEGKQYGISIYLLTWNICLPPGFAQAHGVAEFGADTELTRRYTAYCVRRLFETFPDLGGLITMAAESPPGCVEFVRESIVRGMEAAAVPRKPTLIFWTWCAYPEDAAAIRAAYSGETLIQHYLQYEQLFLNRADPRIGMTSRALGGAPVVALGGIGGAEGYLYWADPQFAADLMADLVRQGGAGTFFQGLEFGERWIAFEAVGRAAWCGTAPREPEHWRGRIAERYGLRDAQAGVLLQAMGDASWVMPRFLHLVHSQTDHYMPQFGLPLVHYLEMPTLDTYVFENHDGIGQRGRLYPRMGLTWPNPDWGLKVLSVREYVTAQRTGQSVTGDTPEEIAVELGTRGHWLGVAVARLRGEAPEAVVRSQELDHMLRLMAISAALGEHYAAKIGAAVAWERYQQGQGDAGAVLPPLDASVAAWEHVAAAAERLYPQPITYWRSGINVPPPWDHWDLWRSYYQHQGGWGETLTWFRRERELVAEALAGPPGEAMLPLPEQIEVPPTDTEPVATFDFEGEMPPELEAVAGKGEVARITREPDEVVSGAGSLLLDSRGSETEWHLLARTDPARLPLQPGTTYVVSFSYRALEQDGRDRTPFAVAARTTAGGWERDVGERRTWGAPPGRIGCRWVRILPEEFSDYYVFCSIHHNCAVVIDDLRIERVREVAAPGGQ